MSNILPFSDDLNMDALNSPLINNEENMSYYNLTFCNFNNLRYNFKKLLNYFFCIPDINLESSDDYQNLNFNE